MRHGPIDKHINDDGQWCAGTLVPTSPLTEYATTPPVQVIRPIPRSKCDECGVVLFTPLTPTSRPPSD